MHTMAEGPASNVISRINRQKNAIQALGNKDAATALLEAMPLCLVARWASESNLLGTSLMLEGFPSQRIPGIATWAAN